MGDADFKIFFSWIHDQVGVDMSPALPANMI